VGCFLWCSWRARSIFLQKLWCDPEQNDRAERHVHEANRVGPSYPESRTPHSISSSKCCKSNDRFCDLLIHGIGTRVTGAASNEMHSSPSRFCSMWYSLIVASTSLSMLDLFLVCAQRTPVNHDQKSHLFYWTARGPSLIEVRKSARSGGIRAPPLVTRRPHGASAVTGGRIWEMTAWTLYFRQLLQTPSEVGLLGEVPRSERFFRWSSFAICPSLPSRLDPARDIHRSGFQNTPSYLAPPWC
jgi:hypothetical protein